ncbi:hypothetical protein [Massilia suwonensis]|uniref:RiboL-PSP-HEPN domain-containing protein n=1 Tax=Massilia suwonensis TaxID=648895 RepID=A0ABW0MM48_9BURK
MIKITGYFHAQDLYKIAKKAAKSRGQRSDNAIIAIMFSVSALEAFINESAGLARLVPTAQRQPVIDGYAAVMRELEERKESLLVKYHMGLLVFSGSTWNEGDQAFQDFKLLNAIRNAVVHMKPDRWESFVEEDKPDPQRPLDDYPKFIRALRQRNVIDCPTNSESWLEVLRDKRVGEWSCQVAARISAAFEQSVPNGYFKSSLQNHIFERR